jgi:NRPS condensation-like uncharacterized protein
MTLPDTFPVTAGDINIFHARLIADQQVTFVLEFSERLDLDRLNAALAALHAALPILSSTLHVKGSHFQRLRQPDYRPAVAVEAEPADRMQAMVHFIGLPCDPEREPPLKLLLLRNQDEDTLCLKIDHVLSDAAGLRHLLVLLAEAYTTAKIASATNPDRGFGQVFRRFSPLALLRAARRANLPAPGPALVPGSLAAEQTFIEHRWLEPGRFAQLREAAKQSEATVNDVLLAGLYQAVLTQLPPGETAAYPVMVPVDMRRYLPEAQRGVVANLSSAVYPSLAAVPGEAPVETLKRVKANMDEFKSDQPGLGPMLLMAMGAQWGGQMIRERYQKAARRGSRFINYTNFGILDATRLAFGLAVARQVYGVGPLQYPPGIIIAVSTYQNTLHWVVQGKGTEPFQRFAREFLQAILDHLP